MPNYRELVKQISDILAAEGFPLSQGNLVARLVNLVRERNALREEVKAAMTLLDQVGAPETSAEWGKLTIRDRVQWATEKIKDLREHKQRDIDFRSGE